MYPRTGPEFAGLAVAVTGGATAIGLATARLLSAHGARVACLDLAPQDVPEPLVKAYVDLTDEHSVRAGLAWAAELLGGIDVLVNIAGIGAQACAEDDPDDEWRRVLAANTRGVERATRAALPYLRRSGTPAIVNTYSIAATTGLPSRALYLSSKGAVLAMTRVMAADLAEDGIRVTCVNPDATVAPDEVAAAIAYLASPLPGAATGTELAVNRGTRGPQHRPRT